MNIKTIINKFKDFIKNNHSIHVNDIVFYQGMKMLVVDVKGKSVIVVNTNETEPTYYSDDIRMFVKC